MHRMRWGVPFAVGAAVLMTAAFRAGTRDSIPYPDGYRQWRHVKSALTGLGGADQSFHHIYANEQAITGYTTGKFPDGAVIVFDKLTGTAANGTIKEGARRLVDVMLRDSARFRSSGGWGYEEFVGDTRTPSLDDTRRTACHTCHTQKQAQGFVFSALRP